MKSKVFLIKSAKKGTEIGDSGALSLEGSESDEGTEALDSSPHNLHSDRHDNIFREAGSFEKLPSVPRHIFSKQRLDRLYTGLLKSSKALTSSTGSAASEARYINISSGINIETDADLAAVREEQTNSSDQLSHTEHSSKKRRVKKQKGDISSAAYAWGNHNDVTSNQIDVHGVLGVTEKSVDTLQTSLSRKRATERFDILLSPEDIKGSPSKVLVGLSPRQLAPLTAKRPEYDDVIKGSPASQGVNASPSSPRLRASGIGPSGTTARPNNALHGMNITGMSPGEGSSDHGHFWPPSPDLFSSPVRVDASPSYSGSPMLYSPTLHGSMSKSSTTLFAANSYGMQSPTLAYQGQSVLDSSSSSPNPNKNTSKHHEADVEKGSKTSLFIRFPSPTQATGSGARTIATTHSKTASTSAQTLTSMSAANKRDSPNRRKGIGASAYNLSSEGSHSNPYINTRSISDATKETPSDNYTSEIAQKLANINEKLQTANREGAAARQTLLANAEAMVSNLPLKYLYNKPELRHNAIERAMKPFIKLAQLRILSILRRAFQIWHTPPVLGPFSEKQAGFLIIASYLDKMLQPIYSKVFLHWMRLYSTRFQKNEDIRKNAAATQISEWYRHCRITKRKLFKFFTDAVKTCLDRRKAIKFTIQFEMTRRSSLQKFVRAIAKKRRKYFAGRSIIRPYLWLHLFRKVQIRLTRRIYCRVLQRWFRMTRYRPAKERYLISKILHFGGYSVVYPKVSPDLLRRNGFLNGFDACASRLQRAWFVSKGNFAAFMIAAARRAKEEYEQMRNDNAIIIQANFRGHLWNLLNLAAKQWNRARRISFAFRHYQYRCWMHKTRRIRKHRYARMIQKWLRHMHEKRLLHHRFVMRRVTFIWKNLKRSLAAFHIQSAYRAHLERERIKLEEFKAWVAQQRANAAKVAKTIVKIQMVWRKLLKSGNRFPRHVYLICWRIVRARRKLETVSAMRIQKYAKPFCAMLKALTQQERIDAANRIWLIAKIYLLKLAIWDRVEATKLIKKKAAILMKRNFRIFLFCRHMKIRTILRRHQKTHAHLIFKGATYLQRWIKRKWAEYYLPVRAAARYEVKKKKDREEARRLLQIQMKSAGFITRFLRMFKPYHFNQKLVARERYRIHRIHMARRLQKFARRIIAWARFYKIMAYRQKMCSTHPMNIRRRYAANVIGFYFKRSREKMELQSRFIHRKFVLNEYRRLEALKVEAYHLRDLAIEDKRRTDENMRATINASWKQGSDVTGKNYYYNYVTGESSWDPPEGWKVPKAIKKWMRQVDDRANIYYYNMETQESAWLPPCHECGEASEKYCTECGTAYCERCFDVVHRLDEANNPDDEEQQDLRLHMWSLTEYEKDRLKPGEIYCLECKRRTAVLTCLVCWDAYCKECFKYTHHTGNLKYHKTTTYSKAKNGWMVVKATSADDVDYYVNGKTGVTTYEKPYELMSEDEKRMYGDFLSHQKAAQEHVQTIAALQLKLEEASFERDSILQDAINAGFMGPSVAKALKSKKSKKQSMDDDIERSQVDVVKEVEKNIKPGMFDWILGSKTEYLKTILKPKERERGNQKSEYMAKLLADAENDRKKEMQEARNAARGV